MIHSVPFRAVPATLYFRGMAVPGETELRPIEGAITDATGKTLRVFRAEQLIVPEPHSDIYVTNVRVDGTDQMPPGVNMTPSWVLGPTTLGNAVWFDTVPIGKPVTIRVTNTGPGAVLFSCELRGKAIP